MGSSALVVDAGVATVAAGPTLTAAAAVAPSTFTVRNAQLSTSVWLADVWRKGTAAGQVRITSPNLVPVAQGIRIQAPTGLGDFLLPKGNYQDLIPQDNLVVQDLGAAAATDVVCLQSYYDSLPGGGMTLVNPGDILGSTDFITPMPVAATASATVGGLGVTNITTTVDQTTANTWYALLGIEVDVNVAAIGISGVDTSQLFIGAPGDNVAYRMRSYFADKSIELGQPCVPLFNSANKGSTNVVVVDNAASTAVNVTLICAQLDGNYSPPSN
jgi:hypothetical protein